MLWRRSPKIFGVGIRARIRSSSSISSATVSPEYYPVVIMGSLFAVLPLILAFMLLQRFWRAGMTAGAVK